MKFIYKTWKGKVDDLDKWKNKSTHKWDGWSVQKQYNSCKWNRNCMTCCLSLKTWSTFEKYIYNCNSQWCEHCIVWRKIFALHHNIVKLVSL
jgi:hypothetical protein